MDNLYLVQNGEIEKVIDSIPPLVTVLKKGDTFGDVSSIFYYLAETNREQKHL